MLKSYTIDGIECTVETDVLETYYAAQAVRAVRKAERRPDDVEAKEEGYFAALDLMDMVFGNEADKILRAISPDGNPKLEAVVAFFSKLMEKMNEDDGTLKNSPPSPGSAPTTPES